VATKSCVNVLSTERDVLRATQAVTKIWWRSFGYDYVLGVIRATHEKVLVCM
jgi:hypothetical protein